MLPYLISLIGCISESICDYKHPLHCISNWHPFQVDAQSNLCNQLTRFWMNHDWSGILLWSHSQWFPTHSFLEMELSPRVVYTSLLPLTRDLFWKYSFTRILLGLCNKAKDKDEDLIYSYRTTRSTHHFLTRIILGQTKVNELDPVNVIFALQHEVFRFYVSIVKMNWSDQMGVSLPVRNLAFMQILQSWEELLHDDCWFRFWQKLSLDNVLEDFSTITVSIWDESDTKDELTRGLRNKRHSTPRFQIAW